MYNPLSELQFMPARLFPGIGETLPVAAGLGLRNRSRATRPAGQRRSSGSARADRASKAEAERRRRLDRIWLNSTTTGLDTGLDMQELKQERKSWVSYADLPSRCRRRATRRPGQPTARQQSHHGLARTFGNRVIDVRRI